MKCLVRQTTTCQALVCLGEELLERAELKNVTNCDLWLQDMSSVEPDRTFRSFRGSIDEFSQNKNRQLALKSQIFRPEEQKGEQEQKTNLSTYACKLKKKPSVSKMLLVIRGRSTEFAVVVQFVCVFSDSVEI